MTLYEKFKSGEMEVMEYYGQAEAILMDAINETLNENKGYTYYYLEKELKDTCDLELITEKNGARKKVIEALKCSNGKIDRDNLNMVLLSTVMEEDDFKTLLLEISSPIDSPKHKRFINVETSNSIYSIVAKSLEILKCKSAVGTLRSNNEDFVVTLVSPFNDNIKLLLVCDGMGGYDGGDLASKFASKKLVNWFNNRNFGEKCLDDIHNELDELVMEIHTHLQHLLIWAGTTLTMALILENETLIANIGDSRTYEIKKGELTQITEDDSEVWKIYYLEEDFSKDELRFLKGNNVIEDCLGNDGTGKIKVHKIKNTYDGLLLVSDGVTDILSDKTMAIILKQPNKEEYLDRLIYEACYGESETIGIDDDLVFQRTNPGKDNASAALYLKR